MSRPAGKGRVPWPDWSYDRAVREPRPSRCRLVALRVIAAPCLAWQAGSALEPPTGVAAILGATDGENGAGGSAVVIAGSGEAVTLAEALPSDAREVTVVLSGGRRRQAEVVRRDAASSAVLLRIRDLPDDVRPLELADSRRLQPLDPVWTAGNAVDAMVLDGAVAISRGVVSGLYDLPANQAGMRGRGGQVLATWHGPAIETDAALNDGNQGGALLDSAGRLIGLTSLAQARERRLPLTVPLARVLDALDLPPASTAPAGGGGEWRRAAEKVAPALALVYLQRLRGPGNPQGVPRPPRRLEEAGPGERDRLRGWWEMHWHQQQVFYSDQPVTALSLGGDLLLTAASNLHGGADEGRVLLPEGPLPCRVLGRDLPLDLALLQCERPHGLPPAPLADAPPELGQAVALLGRHRSDASWTATRGIISATTRRRSQSRHSLLQTDARANYGALGGPLLAADGRVVGLCILLGPADERPWLINSGVAMAVDAVRIAEALPALRAGRTIERPPILGLGVVLRPRGDRLVIGAVTAGTGAETAGLQPGDELVTVAGERATSAEAVARALLKREVGERVGVTVRRNGEELTIEVELKVFTP